jgi:parallel beta-helix repeat protein
MREQRISKGEKTMDTRQLCATSALAGLLALGSSGAIAHHPKKVTVDCTHGHTIARALTRGDEDRHLLVVIRGTCNETVDIDREDVTLRGETGSNPTINGPDPALDTITVRADRVAIEALTVTGGRNGIVARGAGGLSVLGTTVEMTGRTGIILSSGSGGTIDASTVQQNPRDGIALEGSQATIINSNVSLNTRFGVFVSLSSAARIGVDQRNNAAGNTISQNGATGINVIFNGSALIGNNNITSNGADPVTTSGRNGIAVVQATADIAGSNTIANNGGRGVFVRSGSVQIGNPSFAFSTVNTITGNGSASEPGGIFAYLGANLLIRDADIDANNGFGLGLSVRSSAQLINSQIRNSLPAGPNPGDGIRLSLGAALLPNAPNSVISGNAGFGLQCTDPESSVANTIFLTFVPPNSQSPSCTFF